MPFVIIIIGASGIIAQIVLIRELLVSFQGNELSIGFILGNWLIAEALGSYLIRKIKLSLKDYGSIILGFAIIFPILCLIARIVRPLLGIMPGEIITFPVMFLSSLVILLPAGFLHGALFTSSVSVNKRLEMQSQDSNIVRKIPGYVYVLENVGTIIGGVIIAFLLIPYFKTFQIAFFIALLNIFTLFLLPHIISSTIRVLNYLLLIVFTILLFFSPKIELWSIQQIFPNYNVLSSTNSIYSSITVINREEQNTFLVNGVPTIITPFPDQTFIEDFTHFPMLSHLAPEKILLISGGLGGVINQILKHPIKKIEYVELDPSLTQIAQKFSTPLMKKELFDPRVKIINTDARLYLEKDTTRYDLIFVSFTAPLSLQTNRFFSKEFFQTCKNKLKPNGILVTLSPGSLTYISSNMRNLINSHLITLNTVFPENTIIAGDINIYLSSEKSLTSLIPETLYHRLLSRNIATNIFSLGYIQYRTQKYNKDWLTQSLKSNDNNQDEYINHDGLPKGLFLSLFYSNTIANSSLKPVFVFIRKINIAVIFVVLIFVFIILLMIRKKSRASIYIPFAIFTTGICAMVFSLVLSLGFQIRYGYLYYQITILLTTFIAGSTIGGFISNTVMKGKRKYFILAELLIIILFLILLVTLRAKTYPVIFASQIDFYIFLLIAGIFIGIEFPLASKVYHREDTKIVETTGKIYTADLLGGFIGAITVSAIFIPVIGIYQTLLLALLLKIISLLLLLTLPRF